MQPINLVLGATGGIGQAVLKKLIKQDGVVIAAARDADKLKQLSDSYSLDTYIVDGTDVNQVDELFNLIVQKYGRLDSVVNCIGSILLKPAHLTTNDEWQQIISTNLNTAFAIVRAAGKHMSLGGSVVLLSSGAAMIGVPNHEAIAAAKAGINGLVLSAAATYAHRNLRFNAVAPGLVATPATVKITSNKTALAASISNHPLGRIGQPDDIASLIVWLMDPNNSWITGQIIAVDGGLSSLRSRVTA